MVVARARLNKYGKTTNADTGIPTDVWSRSAQPIWLAPTLAQTFSYVSGNVADTAAGAGLRTFRAYCLPTWDTPEASEIITLNGTTPVVGSMSGVIVHRLEPLTWGASGPNVGLITATATVDGTVQAQIEAGTPGPGQTLMAIYGVPSNRYAYLRTIWASILAGSGTTEVNLALLVNSIPDQVTTGYVVKHDVGLRNTDPPYDHAFTPRKEIVGPAIIKLQVLADSNNVVVSGGFDADIQTYRSFADED